MKREDILNMPAGREVDALIAVNVFGWKWTPKMLIPPDDDRRLNWAAEWDMEGRPNWLPDYSTHIADAWVVVDKLNGNNFFYSFEFSKDDKDWMCEWWQRDNLEPIWATAETAPLAICRAALLTVMELE